MRGTCQQGNINGTVRVVAVEVQVNADRAAGVAQDKFMSGQTLAVSAVTGQRQIGGVALGSIDQDVLDVVNIQQFTGFCVLAVIEDETAQGIFFVAVIHDFNFLDTIKDFGQKIVQQGMQDAKSVGGRLAAGMIGHDAKHFIQGFDAIDGAVEFGGIGAFEHHRSRCRHGSLLSYERMTVVPVPIEGDSAHGIGTTATKGTANLAVLPRTLPLKRGTKIALFSADALSYRRGSNPDRGFVCRDEWTIPLKRKKCQV